jgi:hypothetical protein
VHGEAMPGRVYQCWYCGRQINSGHSRYVQEGSGRQWHMQCFDETLVMRDNWLSSGGTGFPTTIGAATVPSDLN